MFDTMHTQCDTMVRNNKSMEDLRRVQIVLKQFCQTEVIGLVILRAYLQLMTESPVMTNTMAF